MPAYAPPRSNLRTLRRPSKDGADFSYAQLLLQELLTTSLIPLEDWDKLDAATKAAINECRSEDELLQRLGVAELLNGYQVSRLRAGKSFGLVLGNYRVLERLGAGGMGVIFLAEHCRMRKRVAVKTLSFSVDMDPRLLSRFYAEMRAVGQLNHPNIVSAVDAGEVRSLDPDAPVLHYFVMEYLAGQDLESLVQSEGALEPSRAGRIAHHIADALVEAHRRGLVHRDIKPSNILITQDGLTKLLDFGLARHDRERLTEPGATLGTIGYMAPEQAQDATKVDVRADIYSLGATLFWCLTGRDPFPLTANIAQDLVQRLTQPPPSVRAVRPELPAGLDAVVRKMMAVNPTERYADAQAAMRALLPFLDTRTRDEPVKPVKPSQSRSLPSNATAKRASRVLIVDDESSVRSFCTLALKTEGIACSEACDGKMALEKLSRKAYDLVLLDVDMPNMDGSETLKQLRAQPPQPNLKVLVLSGRVAPDEMARMLLGGADDFLPKPFSVVQLRARVKAALRHKEAQDRSDLLNRHLLAVNADLEKSLGDRNIDLIASRNALVLALAKLVEFRSTETGAHLLRLQRFCRCLAEEARRGGDYGESIDEFFVQTLEACAPLHDIGKVALPDAILMKPGKLDAEERVAMQQHTVYGADTLREVAKTHGFAAGFIQMAIDITRHHHERWDGRGYPDRLAGEDIPLAARFVAIADVYDALRSRRVYKSALPHHTAVMTMLEGSPGHFDPKLIGVFQRCLPEFERIFREAGD